MGQSCTQQTRCQWDCPAGNDLRVVGVKIGVEEFNVSLDGGAIGRKLLQIGAQGLGGGN